MGLNDISKQNIKEQYENEENLNSRINLYSYNTNKTDWDTWCFRQIKFPNKAKILELGCGTGSFWDKNRSYIKNDWIITLSDFSKGMLESTKERLKQLSHSFIYKQIDAQDIPYDDESFDIVIARHMLYFAQDIEKTLLEIKRVLVNGGLFYATTTARESMAELNELVEKFDSKMGLDNNGMCDRFDDEIGQLLLKKYFSNIEMEVLQGKIVVSDVQSIVSYKASSIHGSTILIGEKKQAFTKYIEDYIKKNGEISITTKTCIFRVKK